MTYLQGLSDQADLVISNVHLKEAKNTRPWHLQELVGMILLVAYGGSIALKSVLNPSKMKNQKCINIYLHLFTTYYMLLWCSPGVHDFDSILSRSAGQTQPKKRSPTETQLHKQNQKLLCITKILTGCRPQ